MSNQHVIIAGVNKCGTTSVFRYLADHPGICASSIKETRFFNAIEGNKTERSYKDYLDYFKHRSGHQKCLLEASPDYFSSGAVVASEIRRILPEVKIIVLIRDPIERLISYYRSAQVYDNYANALLKGMSFSGFVNAAIGAEDSEEVCDPQAIECRRALRQGCYAQDIENFGAVFSQNHCAYYFFEDLVSNPRVLMQDISKFLGLDGNFFRGYEFRVENKTRVYRSPLLQRIGFNINMRLEPFFNKYPTVRRIGQDVYRLLNERRDAGRFRIDRLSYARLEAYYRADRDKLRDILMDKSGANQFPDWLSELGS